MHPRSATGRAMAASLFGNAIFGFSFMFSRIAMETATPLQLLSLRFLFAFVLMNLLLLTGKFRVNLRKPGLVWLIVLGVFQPVVYFLCENYGILYTTSSFSGVMIALIPIASLLFGALFLHERPSAPQVFFSFLSISGVIWMALASGSEGEIQPVGVLLLLGAVLSAVVFNLLTRRLSRVFTAFERTYVMFLVGCIAFTVLGLSECGWSLPSMASPLVSPAFLGSLLYLGGVSSVGAFMLLNYSAAYLPIARTTAFANLTTVVSVVAGAVFLKEPFGWASAAACVLIPVGVLGVQRYAARP